MGEPRDKDARRFYRMSRERWDDAEFLRDAGRTTAAVYMAGYAVEGALEALLLAQAPQKKRPRVLASFRGRVAHDFGWLRHQYEEFGGASPPKDVTTAFAIVDEWDTDLRYDPATIPEEQADRFLAAVRRIRAWADARLS